MVLLNSLTLKGIDQMNGNKRNVWLSLFKMKWLNPFTAQRLISLTSLMVSDELSNFLSCIKQYRWLPSPLPAYASLLWTWSLWPLFWSVCRNLSFMWKNVRNYSAPALSSWRNPLTIASYSHSCLKVLNLTKDSGQNCWEARITGFPGWLNDFHCVSAVEILPLNC